MVLPMMPLVGVRQVRLQLTVPLIVDGEGAVGYGSRCWSACGWPMGGAGRGPLLAESLAGLARLLVRRFWRCSPSPLLGRLLGNPGGASWVPLPVFPKAGLIVGVDGWFLATAG